MCSSLPRGGLYCLQDTHASIRGLPLCLGLLNIVWFVVLVISVGVVMGILSHLDVGGELLREEHYIHVLW